MIKILRSFFGEKKSPPKDPFGSVTFDDEIIHHSRADGTEENVKWVDLIEVGIITTNEGPFLEDVFFMLLGPEKDKGCAIAQGARGTQELVSRLQQLPNFDQTALISAMGSTENNRFVCWKK